MGRGEQRRADGGEGEVALLTMMSISPDAGHSPYELYVGTILDTQAKQATVDAVTWMKE